MDGPVPLEDRARAGLRSTRGPRELNEDGALLRDYTFRARRQRYLCLGAVADGMGGHQAGEVASSTALSVLNEEFNSSRGEFEKDPSLRTEDLLYKLFSVVNSSVYDLAVRNDKLKGMGTTLTAFLAEEGRLCLAHVGDSRAYLIRDGGITQLTEDHSLVGEMVREGVITSQQAASHAKRNVITRAIGVEEMVDIDLITVPLKPGDTVLLCTDGLHGVLEPREMLSHISGSLDLQEACDKLVDLAEAKRTSDNATALLWRMPRLEGRSSGQAGHQRALSGRRFSTGVATSRQVATSGSPSGGRRDRISMRWAVAVLVFIFLAGIASGWLTAAWVKGGGGNDAEVAGTDQQEGGGTISEEDSLRKNCKVMIRSIDEGDREEVKEILEGKGYDEVKTSAPANPHNDPTIYFSADSIFELLIADIPFREPGKVVKKNREGLAEELKVYDAVVVLTTGCLKEAEGH